MKTPCASAIVLAALLGATAFLWTAEKADLKSMIDTFRAQKIEYFLFHNSQDNQFLVVPKFGGRILAVSVGGENLFWAHPEILKGQGGQRSWVSPEGGAKGFIFRPDWKGNRDFSMLDPGNYRVVSAKDNEGLILANTFKAASNDGQENYELTLTREMKLEEDPLKDDPNFKESNYQFLGIDFLHRLRNDSRAGLDKTLSLWSLIQVPPRGTIVVPVSEVKKDAWRATYFELIPPDFVKENPASYSFFIDGSRRYKVGIRPDFAQGAIAYLRKIREGDYSLVVMTFPVKPQACYADRPKGEQETNGDAVQLYSHLEPGSLAFGELECQSWALDLRAGGEAAFPAKIYLYRGSLALLGKIGQSLVCNDFGRAHFFGEESDK